MLSLPAGKSTSTWGQTDLAGHLAIGSAWRGARDHRAERRRQDQSVRGAVRRLAPKSGQVFFNGKDITKLALHQRARLGIGRSYQTPVVPEALTVAQVFKAGRQAYHPFLVPDQAEWGANLAEFHVAGSMIAEQLDTLDRRKLLLSCLLMRRPKLLLMDEPAAGLINSEIDELDEVLRVLAKELNIAILVVEHRMELLETIADRIIVMDAGEIVSQEH